VIKKSKSIDIILLLLTAVVGYLIVMIIDLFLQPYMGSEWRDFAVMSFFYGIGLCYFALSDSELQVIAKYRLLIFQLCYFIATVIFLSLVFIFKLLPLASILLVYGLSLTVLLFCSVILLRYAVNNWEYLRGR
jgi:hypothetical protein